jgi:hypothetical protein
MGFLGDGEMCVKVFVLCEERVARVAGRFRREIERIAAEKNDLKIL